MASIGVKHANAQLRIALLFAKRSSVTSPVGETKVLFGNNNARIGVDWIRE